MAGKINLFWYSYEKLRRKNLSIWSRERLKYFLGRNEENYGDLLSKYIVKKISGKNVSWYRPKTSKPQRNLFAIGSILFYADAKSVVWGSGIIEREHPIINCDVRAVRGPLTRNRLIQLGIKCPKSYGDPALLLAEFYTPQKKKKYKIGIAPHFMDYSLVKKLYGNNPDYIVIRLMTNNVERTTDEITNCDYIISSSLHGLIVAHAYNIPAVWVRFSENIYGDNVKFEDYFSSVALKPYTGEAFLKYLNKKDILKLFNTYDNLPCKDTIKKLKQNLIKSFPKL